MSQLNLPVEVIGAGIAILSSAVTLIVREYFAGKREKRVSLAPEEGVKASADDGFDFLRQKKELKSEADMVISRHTPQGVSERD